MRGVMVLVDLMIFDFDGTLVDTGSDIVNAVNHTLRSMGCPERPYREIIHFIGDGVQRLIEKALGPQGHMLYSEAREIFLNYYEDHLLDSTDLYPGVRDVLGHFQTKRKWIVTNKLHKLTVRIAEELQIRDLFDGILGRDSVRHPKPDPRVIYDILETSGIEKKRVVVIGDGVHDIRLAKNAGVLGCAFLKGLGDREALLHEQPDISFADMSELKTLLR
jgi:phosphoglycolate phosphatase